MPLTAALALNLTGHLVGGALYAMLVALVVAPPPGAARPIQGPWWRQRIRLALLTGVLGLLWNLGALATDLYTLSGHRPPPPVLAGAFSALGFLPAVVVYAVVRADARPRSRVGAAATICALALAGVAALRHGMAVRQGLPVPDVTGLLWLTGGATLLLVLLVLWTRQRRHGSFWVLGLAIFAVSGFHLTGHSGPETWWVALVGHHASLPLAVAILQQEYRFAFADVFLKRALAMLALAGTLLGLWLLADSLLRLDQVRLDEPLTFAVLLTLWLSTTVTYPVVRRTAGRIVDRWLLSRPDPGLQQTVLVRQLTAATSEDEVLHILRAAVASALDARTVTVGTSDEPRMADDLAIVRVPSLRMAAGPGREAAVIMTLPTVRPPIVSLTAGALQHGRRVWSDDLDLLEAFATAASRRLDALRDERRRLDQAMHEQEMGRLAVEAELRAVRAQLQPHFLFNALNTIRYLIAAAPARADAVLLQLTGVLRGVLRRSADEFSTLGEEVELVRAYLAIEQARFESRLHLTIDVPDTLAGLALPALLLQPLVENAVAHGIAPLRRGGAISLTARADPETGSVTIGVRDTGAGGDPRQFSREGGVGLASVGQRLALHYGERATLHVASVRGAGTTVSLTIPVRLDDHRSAADAAQIARRIQPAADGPACSVSASIGTAAASGAAARRHG